MSRGPLASVRVLDASSLYAAPLLGALLADSGADVVALEPPGGHAFRSSPFWPLTARGKRSVVLDPADRARLDALVGAADVVVVNEPAPRLARRGLDPDTLLAVRPSLVVAHVSGHGADGPYADRPGNGTLAEAVTGLTAVTGDPDGPPVLPSALVGDAVTAWAGAFGVVAAVLDVRGGGPGRVLDVNPVDAVLHVAATALTGIAEGRPAPGRAGSRLAGSALRGVFRCADGGWVAAGVSTDRQRATLAELAGRPGSEGADLEDAVRSWVGGLPRARVLDRAVAARLPLAPVNDADDVARDPHLRARGALRTLTGPDGGRVTVPAPAPRTVGAPPAGGPAALAAPGEHTAEVLAAWTGAAG